jgi:hypothetical protein
MQSAPLSHTATVLTCPRQLSPDAYAACRELANAKKRAQPEVNDPTADVFGKPAPHEASLGERVAALAGIEADAQSVQTPITSAASGPVTADSLSVLLTQALRAQDKVWIPLAMR